MSLANMLLNGGSYGVSSDYVAKYTHSTGASRIAMESIEELHDIFIESFYVPEQAELAAAVEGVALEGSQYEAVIEASIGGAFEKIKAFVKKLWEKVKAFFHNIKRYFDALVMSGSQFAKKYEKEIRDIGTLKDFTYTMYNFNDDALDKLNEKLGDVGVDYIITQMEKIPDSHFTDLATLAKDSKGEATSISAQGGPVSDDRLDEFIKGIETECEADTVKATFLKELAISDVSDIDDYATEYTEYLRGGSDKEEQDITSVSDKVKTLLKSKSALSNMNNVERKINKAYDTLIKYLDKIERTADKAISSDAAKQNANAKKHAEVLSKGARLASQALATKQSMSNTIIGTWKQVFGERDTAYKNLILAAFKHAKKQAKEA